MNLQQLNTVFDRLIERTRGIRSILLVTDDGFPIVSTLESGDEEVQSTAVSAILTEAGERSVSELDLGNLDAVVSIGSDGYLIQKRLATNATILLVAEPQVMLGLALARLRQALPEITAAFSRSCLG